MPEKQNRLDEAQVRRAATALLKHVNRNADDGQKRSLLEDEGEVVLAQLSLHKIPENVGAKPMRIPIPHPLRTQDDCEMCLFIKDSSKKGMKELLEKEPVPGLAKMIKLDKLRSQYKEFKARRELVSQYDVFLCDDRILPMLTKALGKTFLAAKKQPVPIRIQRNGKLLPLGTQIARARDSAFLVGSYGDCWAVKLAHTAMTEEEVSANLVAGIAEVVERIPHKWKNIKAISIKSTNSVALPIYSNIGDLPPPPPPPTASVSASAVGDGGEDGTKKRKKQPRPLIKQQLKRIKEQVKAEKKNVDKVPGIAADGRESRKRPRSAEGPGNEEGAEPVTMEASKDVLTPVADTTTTSKAKKKGASSKGGKKNKKSSGVDGGGVQKAEKRRKAEVA